MEAAARVVSCRLDQADAQPRPDECATVVTVGMMAADWPPAREQLLGAGVNIHEYAAERTDQRISEFRVALVGTNAGLLAWAWLDLGSDLALAIVMLHRSGHDEYLWSIQPAMGSASWRPVTPQRLPALVHENLLVHHFEPVC